MEKKLFNSFNYAIETGNIQMFDLLAKDFNKFEEEDKNLLLEQTVIFSPNTEFIQHVMDYGFSLDYKNKMDLTLLHLAAMSSYPETVKFFIQKGLDIEAKEVDGGTPVFVAADLSDNIEVLKTLIDAGADINIVNKNGETLLIAAAGRNPNLEFTKFLLKLGFDTETRDDEGFTALLNAAFWQSNIDVIDELIKVGANINAKTKNGDNLFHLAAFNPSSEVVRYISTEFFTSDVNNNGESCIEKALKKADNPQIVNVYLSKMKQEHVFYACFNSNPKILESLIQSGYDINTTNCYGTTALMFAAKVNSNPLIVKMLLFHSAIWDNHDDEGRNILHYAAANSKPDIYDYLLEDEMYSKLSQEKDSKGKLPEYYRAKPDEF